jgi:hypothetical protein
MPRSIIFVILGIQLAAGPGQEQQIRAKIAATSPEGLAVIEKAKRRAPEKQSSQSAKTLGAAVEDCINGRAQPRIDPIGWAALPNPEGRWTISFYFKDADQKYQEATWQYNPDTGVLFPAEFANATKFWVSRSDHKRP